MHVIWVSLQREEGADAWPAFLPLPDRDLNLPLRFSNGGAMLDLPSLPLGSSLPSANGIPARVLLSANGVALLQFCLAPPPLLHFFIRRPPQRARPHWRLCGAAAAPDFPPAIQRGANPPTQGLSDKRIIIEQSFLFSYITLMVNDKDLHYSEVGFLSIPLLRKQRILVFEIR